LLEALVSDTVGENTLAEKARHLHLTLNPHEGDGVSVTRTDMAIERICKSYIVAIIILF
jgi:hypothetical protein